MFAKRLIPVLFLLPVAAAHAATATGTFTVTATVVASCVVVGGVPLAFGTYPPGTQTDATTTFTPTCTSTLGSRTRETFSGRFNPVEISTSSLMLLRSTGSVSTYPGI